LKKLLAVGVIVLFLGLAIAPSINSERIEIEPLDNGEKEKISIISGVCMNKDTGNGLFRDVEIWVGGDTSVDISAYTSFPLPLYYHVTISGCYLKAPIFIGYCIVASTGRYLVGGIALGDIEWRSQYLFWCRLQV